MRWTRDQLLTALSLYHRTPFGKQHKTHPPIVELANRIDRTPDAVAMKLNNFTSLDPVEAARGIAGLTGASNADRAIWQEFEGRMNELADESEAAQERLNFTPSTVPETTEAVFNGPTEATATVKVRRIQSFFRKTVLTCYGHRCCITGNPVPELLRASHIVPWSESVEHRANPRNGLCLSATFDAAFDRGLIFFDDELRIVLSQRLFSFLPNSELERTFCEAEGRTLQLPLKNHPDIELIRKHRLRHLALSNNSDPIRDFEN